VRDVLDEWLTRGSWPSRTRCGLPTFDVESMILIKRLTLVLKDGVIETVFYPVFPPDQNAAAVITWLSRHPASV
jgi:hypothetical protein